MGYRHRYAFPITEGVYSGSIVQEPKDKKKVRSPLIVEFGNPVDQNVHSCYNRFWPGDISRKAQETQN